MYTRSLLLLSLILVSAARADTQIVDLERMWEVGADEDGEVIFGVISSLAVDDDHGVYVLDRQLTEVSRFSARGEYLGPIGREGEGPGEYHRIGYVFVSAPDEIGVVVRMPGRIVTVRTDGTPGAAIPLPASLVDAPAYFFGAQRAGVDLVLSLRQFQREAAGVRMATALVRIGPSGEEIARLSEFTEVRDMGGEFTIDERNSAPVLWAVARSGEVYVNDTFTAYEVRVHDASGAVVRTLTRPYESRRRTREEMGRNAPRMTIQSREGARREARGIPSPTDRDVQALFARPDGSLWVLSSRGALDAPVGLLGVFDVFAPTGEYVGQIGLRGEGDFVDDGIHIVDDRLYLTRGLRAAERAARGEGDENGNAEPMSVVCYRLGPVEHARVDRD